MHINLKLIDQGAIAAMDGGVGEEEARPIVGVGGGADWFKHRAFFVVSGGFFIGRSRSGASSTSGHDGRGGHNAIDCTGRVCDVG